VKDEDLATRGSRARPITRAIQIGDPQELRKSLGLSAETPYRVMKGLLYWLSTQRDPTADELESRARELGTRDWLAPGATARTLVVGLRELLSSGLLPAALALL
jgi:hypothetical protein